MDKKERREEIKNEREAFILNLWWSSGRELETWRKWEAIYNTLTFPWDKPHKFHLFENKHTLKYLAERTQANLENNSVISTLQFFIEQIEQVMTSKRDQYLFNPESEIWWRKDDDNEKFQLASESQVNRELALCNKTEFFRWLLQSVYKRQSVSWPWINETKLLIWETLYINLEKTAHLWDKEKITLLDNICDYLPDQSREVRPSSEDINRLFKDVSEPK